MKLTVAKRIILMLFWLLSILLFAAVCCAKFTGYGFEWVSERLDPYTDIVLICVAVVYALLAVWTLTLVIRRPTKAADKGFITVDSSDNGRVRLAISAVDQMVRQSAKNVDGVNEMKATILNEDDALDIQVSIVIDNGAHVPTVSLNLQRAIRQYVEMNCGVQVRSVSVSILSVLKPTDKVRPAFRKPQGGEHKRVAGPDETVQVDEPAQSDETIMPDAPDESYEPEPSFEKPVYEDQAETPDGAYAEAEADGAFDTIEETAAEEKRDSEA